MILQRLQAPGIGVALAASMGVSESSISRIKNEQLENVCLLLAQCGLKVVDADRVCVDKRKFEAITTLASAAMSNQEAVRTLVWEGD
jgi:hypothetical protein